MSQIVFSYVKRNKKFEEEEFKETKRGDDGCLGDIGGGDRDLIVAFDQIKLSKNCGTMEMSRQVMEIGERIAVRHHLEIEAAQGRHKPSSLGTR